ncbi:EpsG family protein [Cetobacterium sp. SF1]|uniref:EpsG family protein n=1 Tax=Cetobacterium sp. SF1 TaxID=3417654 RepID=UPI003CE68F1C
MIFITIVIINIFLIFSKRKKYQYLKKRIYFFNIILILILGLRGEKVGIDTFGYVKAYLKSLDYNLFLGEKIYNFEFGYSLFSQICKKLNINKNLYLLITSFIILTPIFNICKKYSKDYFLSIYIYICLGFYMFNFSGLRQSIAISLAFYSYNFIKNREFFKFILCLILGISFHKTMIIFVPAYFLYGLRIKKEIEIIILLILFIFKKNFFMLGKIIKPNLVIVYTHAYTMLIFMLAIYILFFLIKRKNMYIVTYKNYLMMTIYIQVFASLSNTIMRLGYYYYIFIILLIPEIIYDLKKNKLKKELQVLIICFLLLFYCLKKIEIYNYYLFWQ